MINSKKVLLLILLIILIPQLEGCSLVLDLIGVAIAEPFKLIKDVSPEKDSLLEDFYLSGEPISGFSSNPRVKENYDGKMPLTSRIVFSNSQWYSNFFSDNSCSKELSAVLQKHDGENLPIQVKEEVVFNLKEYLDINENLRYSTSSVTVYSYWLVAYYSRNEEKVTIVQIPNFYLSTIKDILSSCHK